MDDGTYAHNPSTGLPEKVNNTLDGVLDYCNADVMTANDYYPFGMAMPGRKHSQGNSKYRYGFNGKENDNEVKGEGGQQDYGMRIYDPRIGRFLSVDPLFKGYPWYTPYQFAGNKPINCVDLDGLEDHDVVKSIQITFGDPNLLITGVLTTAYKQRQSEALALSKSNPGRLQVLQQQSFNAVVAKISEIVSLHFDPNINNTKWTATVGEKLGGDFLQSPEISMYNSYTDYSTPGALVTAGSSIANEVEWAANFLVSNYRLDGFFNAGYYKKAIDIETDPNRKAILMEEMAKQNREKTISWLSMAFIMFQPEPTSAPNLSGSASSLGKFANLENAINRGFTVNPSKFDYFFGRITTGPADNIRRSADNLKDLSTLGIKNEGQFMDVFSQAFEGGAHISTKTTQFGTTIVKRAQVGDKGAINVGFFYQGGNMGATPSVSSIIPKIYK